MKKHFTNTPIGRLRIIGIMEGISYLILLFIAMPLKYMAGIPEAVKAAGSAHGFLFVLFMITLIHVQLSVRWAFKKSLIAFFASLLPFGTFIIDKKLQKEEADHRNNI